MLGGIVELNSTKLRFCFERVRISLSITVYHFHAAPYRKVFHLKIKHEKCMNEIFEYSVDSKIYLNSRHKISFYINFLV